MEAGSEDAVDYRGPPAKTRKRSRETPEERRRKNRERKRQVRAQAAARRPAPNTSSSDEEQPMEIGGIPQVSTAFPFNPQARMALSDRAARPNTSQAPSTSRRLAREGQGNSGATWHDNQPVSAGRELQDGGEGADISDGGGMDGSGGTEPGFDGGVDEHETQGNTNNPPSSDGERQREGRHPNEQVREEARNPPGNTREVPTGEGGADPLTGGTAGPPAEDQGGEQGTAGETPEVCQPLVQNPNEMEKFALAVAKVKGSSHVSDAAIDKLLEVAAENLEVLREYWRNRGTSRLYTRGVKSTLEPFLPTIHTGLLLEEKHPTGLEYRHVQGLTSIPKEQLQDKGKARVIREEAHVTLQDIKRHHMGVNAKWGMTKETAREHFKNAALSIDGVQESHKGKKKFHVVTIRFGDSIYLYKIFNPLIGHPAAHPSLGELLG